jgi:hypothetical protein
MIPPVIPATLLTNTTLPHPFFSIAGIHSCVRRYAEPQLMRHVFSNVSIEMSDVDCTPAWPPVDPALLMRIVGAPRAVVMVA